MKPIHLIHRLGRLAVTLVALACAQAKGQIPADQFSVARGTSPGGGEFSGPVVVLTWPEAAQFAGYENVRRYHLYQKADADLRYPGEPLNRTPITIETDPARLRARIGEEGWNLIAKALASRPPDDPSGTKPDFDPARISALARDSMEWTNLQFLARLNWKIAAAIGQGYLDVPVTHGRTYYYELRGLDATGKEHTLETDIKVTAGVPSPIEPPADLKAEAGDSRVLLTWGERPEAAGFQVFRSEADGPFVVINGSGVTARVVAILDGDTNTPVVNGYLDIQRWDESGAPSVRTDIAVNVEGPSGGFPVVGYYNIDGPHNGVAYSYKVRAVDLLGNPGPVSAPTPPVLPRDKTSPRAPGSVTVTVDDPAGTMEIRWAATTRDTEGHLELVYDPGAPSAPPVPGVNVYWVYRYAGAEDPEEAGALVGKVELDPRESRPQHVRLVDDVSALRPAYGGRTFWYRVISQDAAGNKSARSAAVAGYLRDITPPLPVASLAAAGFDDRIEVSWALSIEPDVDGYLVFRSLCDRGQVGTNAPNPWFQVGYVPQRDALAMAENGEPPRIEDRTVPKNSPLCYAYLVKVQDQSQNMSGRWPPDPWGLPPEPYVCQRLRDTIPPPPAVITQLEARDTSVRVAWLGAPIQDIGAYYVYRSLAEAGPYEFVRGLTVEVDEHGYPAPGRELDGPLVPPSVVGCDDIVLVPYEAMSAGTCTDKTVQPKRIYWYKVLGVDQAGNISPTSQAVPVSTFTYTKAGPAPPAITSATPSASPCRVVVAWAPAFDPNLHSGFMVLRQTAAGGPLRQLGSLVTGASQYTDTQVQRGMSYWYSVATIDARGIPSEPSPAVQATVP